MKTKVQITETKDKNDSFVINEKYDIQKGQYGVWEANKDSFTFVPKGSAVYIDKVINHLDTKEISFVLRFFNAEGNEVRVPFQRKDLTEQGIMSLLAYGVQVLKQDAKILIASILNQEPSAKRESIHTSVGFTKYDGKTVFLAHKAIGVESSYKGNLKIGQIGKYSEWKKMIETEVLGNIPLEFILSVACSGVFVDYLQEKIPLENIIIALVSESSTGKSTAGELLVSCGAKPSFQGDGLVLNFSDTQNAIMSIIPSSYPVLIDEGSLLSYNPTKLLYNLAMGTEKRRLNKDLEKVPPSYFKTAIAITSEKSLLSISDENSGLLVRVLEIENVTWTRDAQSADTIKEVINANYGWLIPKIAEYIISVEEAYEEDKIKNVYWECYNDLIEEAKNQGCNNSLMGRACKQYAVILLSVCFINSVMDIELDYYGIIDFILKHSPVRESDSANIGSRAMTYLMQFISENYSKFLSKDNDNVTPINCLGRIRDVRQSVMKNGISYNKRLYISEIVLQKILKDRKFPDMKVVLKKWKEEGVLKCEKDRYLSNIKIIDDLPVKGYIINLLNLDNDDNK